MVGMIDVASMVVQEQPQAKRTGKDTESIIDPDAVGVAAPIFIGAESDHAEG